MSHWNTYIVQRKFYEKDLNIAFTIYLIKEVLYKIEINSQLNPWNDSRINVTFKQIIINIIFHLVVSTNEFKIDYLTWVAANTTQLIEI